MGEAVDLRKLFFGYAVEREEQMKRSSRRVVYYTRADTAIKLLRNREIWLRSVGFMNDASEIRYGMECMEYALERGGEQRLYGILDRAHPELARETVANLRNAANAMFAATHITCVSEHLGDREDRFGRLSMWRAYGGSTGVALVFNTQAMFGESNAYSTFTSPVLYEEREGFESMFAEALDRLGSQVDAIAEQTRETIAHVLYEMLHFGVLSTKHPAFSEEREWRIIHAPYHEANLRMKPSIETIGGVPQMVYKLPLVNVPEEGLTGMDTLESLDRIIIGPSNNPIEMSFVLHEVLREQGIEDPYSKIVISGVPLRVAS